MANDQGPNIDKINIKKLLDWKIGDKLTAEHLQQVVTVLKALGGMGPTSQILPPQDTSHFVRMFKVKALDKDVIICFEWNGLEKGEDEVKVALPFLLRKTPFDEATREDPELRAGISYVYSEFNLRVATKAGEGEDDDETEDQIIVDSYEEDDIIFAMKGVFGNTSVYHDEEEEEPIIWVDMNLDGRYWALDDDPPEEEE